MSRPADIAPPSLVQWLTTEQVFEVFGMNRPSHAYALPTPHPSQKEYGILLFKDTLTSSIGRFDGGWTLLYRGDMCRKNTDCQSDIHHIAEVHGIGKLESRCRNPASPVRMWRRVMAEKRAAKEAVTVDYWPVWSITVIIYHQRPHHSIPFSPVISSITKKDYGKTFARPWTFIRKIQGSNGKCPVLLPRLLSRLPWRDHQQSAASWIAQYLHLRTSEDTAWRTTTRLSEKAEALRYRRYGDCKRALRVLWQETNERQFHWLLRLKYTQEERILAMSRHSCTSSLFQAANAPLPKLP